MYKDIVLEMAVLKGNTSLIETFDITNTFYIRKLTDEDRKQLMDLSVTVGKYSTTHILALSNSVKETYSELIKTKHYGEIAKLSFQNLMNSLTKIRYFITDAFKYLLFKIWSYVPSKIKDSVSTLYTNYFEEYVTSISKIFSERVIIIFGVRMLLSEFLKNIFFVFTAGLILYHIFFKENNKVETPLEENYDYNKEVFKSVYPMTFIMLEAISSFSTAVDIPERPKPKSPYGIEEPTTFYERVVSFLKEIGEEIKKTVTTSIGKLIGLMLIVPLLIVAIIIIDHLVSKLSEGNVKRVLSSSLKTIKNILKINIDEEKKENPQISTN